MRMKYRMGPLIVLMVGAVATVAVLAGGDPPAASTRPTSFTPVQSLERLMEGQDKLYDEIKEGILDKSWKPAETSAWLLAELANVNRFQKNKKSAEAKYQELAGRMSSECVELARALRKRDEATAKTRFSAISKTCNECHDAYKVKKR